MWYQQFLPKKSAFMYSNKQYCIWYAYIDWLKLLCNKPRTHYSLPLRWSFKLILKSLHYTRAKFVQHKLFCTFGVCSVRAYMCWASYICNGRAYVSVCVCVWTFVSECNRNNLCVDRASIYTYILTVHARMNMMCTNIKHTLTAEFASRRPAVRREELRATGRFIEDLL